MIIRLTVLRGAASAAPGEGVAVHRRRLGTFAVLLLLVASACVGGDDDDDDGVPTSTTAPGGAAGRHYGGEVEGTDALIGIAAGARDASPSTCARTERSRSGSSPTLRPRIGARIERRRYGRAQDQRRGRGGHDHPGRRLRARLQCAEAGEACDPTGRSGHRGRAALAGWVTVGDRTTPARSPPRPRARRRRWAWRHPSRARRSIRPSPSRPGPPPWCTAVTIIGDSTFVTANRPQTFVIGGVGDSYASGEGNPVTKPSSAVRTSPTTSRRVGHELRHERLPPE